MDSSEEHTPLFNKEPRLGKSKQFVQGSIACKSQTWADALYFVYVCAGRGVTSVLQTRKLQPREVSELLTAVPCGG